MNQICIDILNNNSKPHKDCILWTGKRSPEGYGYFYLKELKKNIIAHRKSFELFNGDIPKGSMICHSCNNRRCINPKHLYLGNHKDNARDRVLYNFYEKTSKRRKTNFKITTFIRNLFFDYIFVLNGFEKRDPEKEYSIMYRVYGELLEKKPIKKRILYNEYNYY